MEIYDVIVIGGGPSGINCGIEAQKRGMRCLILEKGALVNSIYHFPQNMTFFSTSRLLEIGNIPFISDKDKPTRQEALEYYRRLVDHFKLDIQTYEEVTGLLTKNENEYLVETVYHRYRTQAVVVATGFYDTPRMLDVPGEDLPKVTHYYRDPHPYTGQDVLVVGAANSACDAALETWTKGANVTMAIRGEGIYERVKYWIKPNIENRIKEGSIRAYFLTEVKEIKEKEVVLEGPDGQFTIRNDFVLAMTGYQPNFPFLEKLGISVEANEDCVPLHEPGSLETNRPRVYLAGVVCGGLQTSKLFIENTRDHAGRIMDDLLAKLPKKVKAG